MQEASTIVFLSSAYVDHVFENYVPRAQADHLRSKAVVVPNGVNSFWLNSQGDAKPAPSQPYRIITVCSIDKNKNVEAVVKAVLLLRQKGYNVQLRVVGDGPLKKQLERQQKGAEGVSFSGRINCQTELLRQYREAHIFVMPSFQETFGIAYLEAMSQGLPVIYSRGQGFDGHFANGSVGWAVDPRSHVDIADAILKTLCGYERVSAKCVESVREFSWGKIAQTYELLYSSLL